MIRTSSIRWSAKPYIAAPVKIEGITENDKQLIARAEKLGRWDWREIHWNLIPKADTPQAIKRLREIMNELIDFCNESL